MYVEGEEEVTCPKTKQKVMKRKVVRGGAIRTAAAERGREINNIIRGLPRRSTPQLLNSKFHHSSYMGRYSLHQTSHFYSPSDMLAPSSCASDASRICS